MKPESIPELRDIILSNSDLRVRGGGSKPALSQTQEPVKWIETGALAGLRQYNPDEFTFTAMAGTPLAELEAVLGEHGQFMPFDPPLVEGGATLGGTVAAGLSGACRYRYGGVRDFILGVSFIDGQGNLVKGGGKVVKNAAGFDLPKLMVGSVGQYGPLVEMSFKVFPRPESYCTLRWRLSTLSEALQTLARLVSSAMELFALDLEPDGEQFNLLVRLGGAQQTLSERQARLQNQAGGDCEPLDEAQDAAVWHERREFGWLPVGSTLVKIPLTPSRVAALENFLSRHAARRIYSVAANVAWVGWPGPVQVLDHFLQGVGLTGLVLMGNSEHISLGARRQEVFAKRLQQALDPLSKFSKPLAEG
jgi:glycolate oxidase FAD binding subunit